MADYTIKAGDAGSVIEAVLKENAAEVGRPRPRPLRTSSSRVFCSAMMPRASPR
jgi:hypothetical protein